jgi:hypothetical protein
VTYQQYYTQWYQWYNATYLSNTTTTTTTGNRTGPQVSTTLPNPNQEQPTPTVPVNAADNAEAERQRAARRATIVWLAAKLMLVLFVLTRHASIPRMIFIYVCAFIFFLYQTGQLRFIVRRVRPWRTTQGKERVLGKNRRFRAILDGDTKHNLVNTSYTDGFFKGHQQCSRSTNYTAEDN